MDKPKYIQNAIVWRRNPYSRGNEEKGWWLRCSEMNLVDMNGEHVYISALCGSTIVYYHNVYPYEDWMEEYVGTDKDLPNDERLKKDE